ncbi:MAG: hypothetical protein ACFKPT_01460 [Gloeotrichia echinulata GP01]
MQLISVKGIKELGQDFSSLAVKVHNFKHNLSSRRLMADAPKKAGRTRQRRET